MVTHIALKKFGVKYNKEFKIAGIHKMKKAELINAIEDKLKKSRKEIKDEYKQLKNMVKVKKGFHKMPDGSIMANSDMPKSKPKFKIDQSKQPKTTPSKIVMSKKPELNTKKITPKTNDLNYNILQKYFTYINYAYDISLLNGNNTSKYYDNAEKAYEKELPIFNNVIKTYNKVKYEREHKNDFHPNYNYNFEIRYPNDRAIKVMKKFKNVVKKMREQLNIKNVNNRIRPPVGPERFTTFPDKKTPDRPNINIKSLENKPLENIQIKIDVKNRKIKAMKYLNEYNKTIYQTLKPYGITSEAKAKKMTREELKKIYRKILLEKHPDKTGGSSKSFNRYKTAIQILMDTIK